jgi:hypothetical protein
MTRSPERVVVSRALVFHHGRAAPLYAGDGESGEISELGLAVDLQTKLTRLAQRLKES